MENINKILTIIIPVYNEENTICNVLDKLKTRKEIAEIILIDDGSTDNSVDLINRYVNKSNIRLLKQPYNMGKGAAITRGFKEAGAPFVLIQDADLEYSPEDYPVLLKPVIDHDADVVYGSRFQGGPGRVLYYKHHLGNKFITFLSNLFSDLNFTDVETCYKLFRREIIQNINFESKRFGIEIEITAKLAKAEGLKIYEVPISYHGRTYSEGKKITWKDGVSALYHIIKFNFFKDPKGYFKRPWRDVFSENERWYPDA
ncbi:MAG: glycosyltransferase family 2 protein [Victivallales bacterium]|nr:glycosyltransferase family 2 protein [Victivallales bacterium]MCF7889121.1 glycosyltransferase family 2 protein [Victivallales bacterium]